MKTGYGLEDLEIVVGVSIRSNEKFLLFHDFQACAGAHIAFSPWEKRQGHEADHSPPTIAEVKKT
jgi:hypothetical protein